MTPEDRAERTRLVMDTAKSVLASRDLGSRRVAHARSASVRTGINESDIGRGIRILRYCTQGIIDSVYAGKIKLTTAERLSKLALDQQDRVATKVLAAKNGGNVLAHTSNHVVYGRDARIRRAIEQLETAAQLLEEFTSESGEVDPEWRPRVLVVRRRVSRISTKWRSNS